MFAVEYHLPVPLIFCRVQRGLCVIAQLLVETRSSNISAMAPVQIEIFYWNLAC